MALLLIQNYIFDINKLCLLFIFYFSFRNLNLSCYNVIVIILRDLLIIYPLDAVRFSELL